MWGVQLLLVNAYILYKMTHLIMWRKDKKSLMSHYDLSHWHGFSVTMVLLLTTNLQRSEKFKTAWPLIAQPPLRRLGGSMIALLILTLECFEDGLMMTCTIPVLRQMPNVLAAVYADGSRTPGAEEQVKHKLLQEV